MKTTIRKITYLAAFTLITLILMALLFRATLYWQIPVAPDEPYGLGDIIELLCYFAILGNAGLLIVLSLILALLKNYATALKGSVVSIVAPLTYFILHPLIPAPV